MITEAWNNFMVWYENVNLDTILNWVTTIGIPVLVSILIKVGNNSKVKEVLALAKSTETKEAYNKTIDLLNTKIEVLENGNVDATEKIDKLSALVLLLINSANINAENKAYAVKVFNAKESKITEKIETVAEVVQQVVTKVEESVANEIELQKTVGDTLETSLQALKKDVQN